MICTNCGKNLKPTAVFCSGCGVRIAAQSPPQQSSMPRNMGSHNSMGGQTPQGSVSRSSFPQGNTQGSSINQGITGGGFPQGGFQGSSINQGTPQWGGQPRHGVYPAATHAPGKTMLKVVGILYVFNVISIFASLFMLTQVDYWNRVMPIASGMSWAVYYGVSIISSSYSVAIGIIAIIYCARPEKAELLKILGIGSIIIVVLVYAFAFMSGAMDALGFGAVAILTILISLILPTLYIIGAAKNQQKQNNSLRSY